jgi:hypothetical protein
MKELSIPAFSRAHHWTAHDFILDHPYCSTAAPKVPNTLIHPNPEAAGTRKDGNLRRLRTFLCNRALSTLHIESSPREILGRVETHEFDQIPYPDNSQT